LSITLEEADGRSGGSSDEAGPSRSRRTTDKERDVNEAKSKIELDEGLRGKGKGKAREEVLVEKSNVMMV
jgi:ATP-dependent Clp protease ATP-binding subunit ClpX